MKKAFKKWMDAAPTKKEEKVYLKYDGTDVEILKREELAFYAGYRAALRSKRTK